ncbi:protein-disulfide reductase DsbD family protein [Alishewanella tabrizica]|uniref:Thio:disulfide interchange protein n=1 Tax=Alishewanella tabrizica TaxID=671278 RepID=A0ABQ2WV86_9ALTE|nr:protein-disulfide reductase DsbD domain-containing protein [Alishewanella tabrizica]GGW69140.1 thio:disulfide interchange protein [Alishewanella tabrizica]
MWVMRLITTLLCGMVLGVSPTVLAASSGWQPAKHLQAELVSEYQTVQPGQTLQLALHFIPDEYWHTYWINPGDSGLPTSIAWQLPTGVTAGDIQWPTPQAFSIPPMMNYGFAGPTLLLIDLTVPSSYSATTLDITAKVDWLVCEEICIPAEASLQLSLPVSSSAEPSVYGQSLVSQAKARQPQTLAITGFYDIAGDSFSAAIAGLPDDDFQQFFVSATELVDHAAPQHVLFSEGEWLLRQKLNTYFTHAPTDFSVVLVSANGQSYSVTLQAAAEAAVVSSPDASQQALWLVLLMAAAGGLILNLMPCVFPVLSLKALSIAGNTGQQQQQKRDALWYSLGVVLSFVALASVLLALRAAGTAVGWGFQLQSPILVAALAYLLFALGLSLSGLVQFGLGLMNAGGGLTQQKGAKGAFFTGVLAVIVASPCTAPFMGGALGYAVTQPPFLALLVFVALGLGMALPFLLLAFVPGLAKRLPKPGAWMDTLKQVLAYPLYLSAVWLAWVYGRQTGIDALALLLCGAVALAAACWLWGRWQLRREGKADAVFALLLVALALSVLWMATPKLAENSSSPEVTQTHWQSWSADKHAALLAAGKPVLVNMTADWCITCLVNERVALNTDSSKAALALFDVTYLKGDWTRRDAAITAYLHQYQRDGVPLYVLYWPGQPAEVLPQILTPDTLRQTLERLSKQ